jgi:hypothetical protein
MFGFRWLLSQMRKGHANRGIDVEQIAELMVILPVALHVAAVERLAAIEVLAAAARSKWSSPR